MNTTPTSITSITDKRRDFHRLHQAGCFALPNPWDIGSARMLQGMGFAALATTSAGFAWSVDHPDNGVSRDMALAHLAELVAATDVPVNADFESGFAADPAGVAGLSIEVSTGDAARPLFTVDDAVARLRAAIDRAGGDTLLVGRARSGRDHRPHHQRTLDRAGGDGGWTHARPFVAGRRQHRQTQHHAQPGLARWIEKGCLLNKGSVRSGLCK